MKRTFTVNLNNIVFNIDDDAYEKLLRYFSEIESQFESESERTEIMADIEARIAELFSERLQKNKNVVTMNDVEAIIEIMGKPSQYTDDEDNENTKEAEQKQKQKRRFYRDPENTVFAGIAGGVSTYFEWDVTLVRIIMVLLVFLGAGFIIPVYLIVWFVVPQALTASQRLEMQGEEVTVESIKTELNNVKNYMESEKFKQSATNLGEKVMSSMPLFLKIIFGFLGGVFAFAGVVVISVLIFLLGVLILQGSLMVDVIPQSMGTWANFSTDNLILLIISILLLVGCPIYLIVRGILRAVNGRNCCKSKVGIWVTIALWTAGIALFYSVGLRTIFNISQNGATPLCIGWSDENASRVDEKRNLAPFNALDIEGNIELILVQDSTQKVILSAESEYLPDIETTVENGTLRIKTKRIFLDKAIKVTVSADNVQLIKAAGATSISSYSQLKLDTLSIQLLGASKADLNVQITNLLNLELRGASKAELTGMTENLRIKAVGASKIEANELLSKHASLDLIGASHAEVFATESINAKATGASKISCKGNPKKVMQNDSGASQITIE